MNFLLLVALVGNRLKILNKTLSFTKNYMADRNK